MDMGWLPHLWNFVVSWWSLMWSWSGLGWAPASVSVVLLIYKYCSLYRRASGMASGARVASAARSLTSIVWTNEAKLAAVAWGIVLLVAAGRVVWADHRGLVAKSARSELAVENLTKRAAAMKVEIADLKSKIPPRAVPSWQRPAGPEEGPFGPITSVEIATAFRSLRHPCYVMVTAQPSTRVFGDALRWILTQPEGGGCTSWREPSPREVGTAPILHTSQGGIVIHYRSSFASARRIVRQFVGAFNVEISHAMPPTSPENLVWIDIGPGSPWKS